MKHNQAVKKLLPLISGLNISRFFDKLLSKYPNEMARTWMSVTEGGGDLIRHISIDDCLNRLMMELIENKVDRSKAVRHFCKFYPIKALNAIEGEPTKEPVVDILKEDSAESSADDLPRTPTGLILREVKRITKTTEFAGEVEWFVAWNKQKSLYECLNREDSIIPVIKAVNQLTGMELRQCMEFVKGHINEWRDIWRVWHQ